MPTPSYLYCVITVSILWTLWFIALGLERGWFRDVWRNWATLPPSTKAIMAVLCVYCTVVAQKPTNVNSTAASPHTGQPAGGAVAQQQQAQPASPSTQPPLPATQGGPSGVQSEPSRIVLQATLAADPRVAAAFSGEPGWSLPAAVPATPRLNALSFAGNATNPVSPVCFSNVAAVTVQTLMLVTRGDAADLATLVDAPETARLRLVSDGSRQTEPGAAELSLTQQFIPQQWQVVAVDFESPADLTEMFFGGTAGRPAWNRGWRGGDRGDRGVQHAAGRGCPGGRGQLSLDPLGSCPAPRLAGAAPGRDRRGTQLRACVGVGASPKMSAMT
ncbi:MAG: hypothetical protein ACOX7Q_13105 [Kiritimatiellia bacterium]|jgi:hypothetical protein